MSWRAVFGNSFTRSLAVPDLTPCDLVLKGSVALAASAALFACGPAQAQDLPFGCPKADAVPYVEPIELKAGFGPDPFTYQDEFIVGTTDLHECGVEETGFVDQRPDYVLRWEGEAPLLVIAVESDADTPLLIHDPTDHWLFDDNGEDQNPMVVIENPTPGSYAILVGTAVVPVQEFPGVLQISQAEP
jgi:hypothetical protein